MYLRLSVTDACDFRCWYCRPEGDAACPAPAAGPVADRETLAGLLAGIHRAAPLTKVRLTGGEPLLRTDLTGIVGDLRAALPGAELALTTNGRLLAERAAPLMAAGLDRINVSLDSLDPTRFREITGRDALAAVRAGLRAARAAGFARLKLNAVLLRSGAGRELEALLDFAAVEGAELRFIELMPFGPAAPRFEAEFVPMAEALATLRAAGGYLGPLEGSGTAQRHRFARAAGEVIIGFIPSVTEPFCATCDRLRLDARGRLYPCLRREDGVDLTPHLAEGPEAVAEAVRGVLCDKGHPVRGRPGQHWPVRSLAGIGG